MRALLVVALGGCTGTIAGPAPERQDEVALASMCAGRPEGTMMCIDGTQIECLAEGQRVTPCERGCNRAGVRCEGTGGGTSTGGGGGGGHEPQTCYETCRETLCDTCEETVCDECQVETCGTCVETACWWCDTDPDSEICCWDESFECCTTAVEPCNCRLESFACDCVEHTWACNPYPC